MLLTLAASATDAIAPVISTTLSTSDRIQLAGIILSTTASIVAIIISVFTLHQNNKMIEDSTRPYIVMYTGTTNFQSPNYYLIMKNFGQTGAYVTSFCCDYDLIKCSYNDKRAPFSHIENTFLAPGQSYTCSINPLKLFENPRPIKIDISYKSGTKTYNDTIILNVEADPGMMHTRAATRDKELKIISYTLQDIAEKML